MKDETCHKYSIPDNVVVYNILIIEDPKQSNKKSRMKEFEDSFGI